jgi:toxin ParE1/3/4
MKKHPLGSKFAFAKSADAELDEAVAYYNNQKTGLGDDFNSEVDQAIQEVVEHPHRWAMIARDTRRYRLKRFPYGLIYKIRPKRIWFLAVMHLKRRPGYWKGREAEFET